jgi:undecaprenyl-diphosphatase
LQNWIFDFRSRSFVLLVILFLITTALVSFGITEEFDQSVIFFVSENVGNPILDIIMQSITESGDTFYMLGFGVVTLIIKKSLKYIICSPWRF